MIYIILIVYISFTFLGSLRRSQIENPTPESYFLANRSLKTIGLFFTILATNFSAFYFLGFAGEGYKIGYSHYIIMSLGTAFAGISILLLGIPAWTLGKKHGYITPSELVFGQTQSRSLALLVSIVMVLFTMPYLALQVVGGGYILESLTGGDISYFLGVIILTVFTIIYVLIGGMESVTKTDMKQGSIMIILMLLAVILIASEFGGIAKANEMALSLKPELFSIEGVDEHYTPRKWFSFMVFWILCIPMFPQLFMRFYIADNVRILKQSAVLYAFAPIFVSLLPVMIGVWGHISFPDLSVAEADKILPMMLKKHTSEWIEAIVMTGAIAAFMSTLDSQLLALSTMLTRDFYLPFTKRNLSLRQEVRIGRIIVAVLAMTGMCIAFQPFDTIFDMGKMAFSGLAILFPIVLAVLRFRIVNMTYPITAIIVGLTLLLGFYYKVIPETWTFGFESFIMVSGVSFAICFLGVKSARNSN